MASILKVDTIQDQSGNNIINENADTITIGASGDTITVPTGASLTVPNGGLSGQNYPAFEAKLSSSQTVGTNGAYNKILFNDEIFDTDGYYDNTTNYRFTPLVAGKYFVHVSVRAGETNASALQETAPQIRLNGANGPYVAYFDLIANPGKAMTPSFQTILDMNGTTDYIEAYCFYESTAFFGTETFSSSGTFFGAFRIGD
jgi:hypothetical protein